MSLLYRAIWSDCRGDAASIARDAMERWVDRKTAGAMTLPDSGTASARVVIPARPPRFPEQQYDAEIAVGHAVGDGSIPEAFSATFIELKADGTRWDTTLRSWTESSDGMETAWLWVDVECVGPIDLGRLAIAAPALAVDLIERGTEPAHGGLRLSSAPTLVAGREAGEALAETITDPTRDLPLVVFSADENVISRLPDTHSLRDITDSAARRLAGVASVYVADAAACWALTHALGSDFAVWGGAFRTYLPNVDPAIPGNNFRHRYVLPDRYIAYRDSAAITAGRTLVRCPARGDRRPRTMPRRSCSVGHSPTTFRSSRISWRRTTTRSPRVSRLSMRRSVAARTGTSRWSRTTKTPSRSGRSWPLNSARRSTRFGTRWSCSSATASTIARGPQSCLRRRCPMRADSLSDAAAKAQLLLADRFALPDAALRDLADLDSTVESKAWGQTAWRGFRALHAYAVDQSNGANPATSDIGA